MLITDKINEHLTNNSAFVIENKKAELIAEVIVDEKEQIDDNPSLLKEETQPVPQSIKIQIYT